MKDIESRRDERLRNRKTENIVYAGLWILGIGFFLLNAARGRAEMSKPLLDLPMLMRMLRSVLPFIVLFLINNYILIPSLLLRNRIWQYFATVGLLVLCLWTYQYVSFMSFHQFAPRPDLPRPPHHHSLLPLPLVLDFTYAFVVVGANIAVALLFQRIDDTLERESLTKANAETELAYLKAQINPHFYMNMLNNIHGMIEIDPEKAQAMVIDMSQLMRYMLYDSSRTRIPLANEIDFIKNYLRIMRRRFPADRVSIEGSFPDDKDIAGIDVPPLLTLVFMENAFKHGISFRNPSFVKVSMKIEGDRLIFRCTNSRRSDNEETKGTGIGLPNIRQRLALLYGSKMSLDITETETEYDVKLSTQI